MSKAYTSCMAAKRILAAPKRCTAAGVYGELGWHSMATRAERFALCLWARMAQRTQEGDLLAAALASQKQLLRRAATSGSGGWMWLAKVKGMHRRGRPFIDCDRAMDALVDWWTGRGQGVHQARGQSALGG